MTKKVLKTDLERIEKEIKTESKYSAMFQPFLDELLKNEYFLSNASHSIIDLIYSGSLETFMREQALLQSPYFDNMPTTKEKKLQLVDVEAIYPNYNKLQVLYLEIKKLSPQQRGKIYNFYVDTDGALRLTDTFKLTIKNTYTIYGDEKQLEALNALNELLESAKRIQENYNLSIFTPGLVSGLFSGKLKDAYINVYGVVLNK
jgi:hypothetical protein